MEKDGPDVEKVQNATGSSPTDLGISESKTTSPSLISFETTTTTTIDKEDVVAVTMKIIPADTTVVSIVTSPVSGGADSTVTAEPEANQTRMPEKTTARAPRAEKGDVFVTSASSSTTTAPVTNTERITEVVEAVTGRRVVQSAATAAAEITARTTTLSPFFGGLSEETTEMMMDDYYEDEGTRMGGAAVGKPSVTAPSRQNLGAFGDNEHGIKVRTYTVKCIFRFLSEILPFNVLDQKTLLLNSW